MEFELDPLLDRKPVEIQEDGGDVVTGVRRAAKF